MEDLASVGPGFAGGWEMRPALSSDEAHQGPFRDCYGQERSLQDVVYCSHCKGGNFAGFSRPFLASGFICGLLFFFILFIDHVLRTLDFSKT